MAITAGRPPERRARPSVGPGCDRRSNRLRADLALLAGFIEVYCRSRHKGVDRQPVRLKTHEVEAIHGRPLLLCNDCRRLLTHAFVKRTHCPLDPKPVCKRCPVHCYAPAYRRRIREVMKVAGRRMVLSGRVDYLFHLLF